MHATPAVSAADAFAFFEAELRKLREHKYYESQRAARDVGFEHSLVSWFTHHRHQWREAYLGGK